MDYIFHYIKMGDKIHPEVTENELRRTYLSKFKQGEIIDVTFKKHRKERTNQQNRYLWGIIYFLIGKEIGESSETVHELMKYKFLRSRKEVNGTEMEYLESTTDLSTDEFSQYIEKIKEWSLHFLNVTIPEANQVELDTIKER